MDSGNGYSRTTTIRFVGLESHGFEFFHIGKRVYFHLASDSVEWAWQFFEFESEVLAISTKPLQGIEAILFVATDDGNTYAILVG